ncbi:rRNA maturation RNase YbeY [Candidatus Falkowbacteria bacterium]|nr:rRNA maturation RNase YbeY [Candidatus Falkowbacteria bacterium]
MKIEINNRTKSKIDLKLVKLVAAEFARANKIKPKEISIAFVGDEEIKKINFKYRGLDKVTDILSFSGDGDYFGEIVIDYDQIKRQAVDFKNSIHKELVFILVHGLLHLLGYSDETEEERKKMIKTGEEFIKNYL